VFHPSGREFLTTSLEDGLFRRHRFPGGEVIGELSHEDACPTVDPDGVAELWGDFMEYLSDRRAIVQTTEYRILLIDLEEMKVEGEVVLPAPPTKDHIPDAEDQVSIGHDVQQFFRLSQGRLLAIHGQGLRTGESDWVLRVWDATLFGQTGMPDQGEP
jgi:hypothetical protein